MMIYDGSIRPREIVIVGGGLEGWLTASLIKAYMIKRGLGDQSQVTLIESPEMPFLNHSPIGLGEGSWPTMRQTLQTIGIEEERFMRLSRASFKQGSRYIAWRANHQNYDHPFDIHAHFKPRNRLYSAIQMEEDLARLISCQPKMIDRNLAPKLSTNPAYQGVLNYGYHFDTIELTKLLIEHATTQLKIHRHIDKIDQINSNERGYLTSLSLASGRQIKGQLFVDCSGLQGQLIKRHFKAPWYTLKGSIFNNALINTHVPYMQYEQPILSATYLTAWEAGWSWDMNLAHRRSVGIAYCDLLCSEDQARQQLENYLFQHCKLSLNASRSAIMQSVRFESGYHEVFWLKNCVAVGMSSGFVEPLEASAFVVLERSALKLAKAISIQKLNLTQVVEDYNEDLLETWQELAIFLKLHYLSSQRQDPYWRTHQDQSTWPDGLAEIVSMSENKIRTNLSKLSTSVFPLASYACVLHGMTGAQGIQFSHGNSQSLDHVLKAKMKDELSLCRELRSHRSKINDYKK